MENILKFLPIISYSLLTLLIIVSLVYIINLLIATNRLKRSIKHNKKLIDNMQDKLSKLHNKKQYLLDYFNNWSTSISKYLSTIFIVKGLFNHFNKNKT